MLYQDEPVYGLFLKLIVVAAPAMLLAGSLWLWSLDESTGALALLVEAFIIGLIFWLLFPRRYQVYEDHLRIVLGGPVSVRVPFDKIEKIETAGRLYFSVNFATRFTTNYVAIVKKRGMSIAITPRAEDLFTEHANHALSEWRKAAGGTARY